jgi:inner membrane protein
MDILTQGVLGAALPAATRGSARTGIAAAAGFLAGMAPDLDILIRSSTDSLLFLEYHRQFSHSLVFIPVGGLLVAALLHLAFRRRGDPGFPRLWLFCTLGYATHGLLDAATSYGTLLLWPFSETRFAFSIVSIVDPLFTLPILSLVILGVARRNGRWARLAMVWATCYLGFGAFQHHAARSMAERLAEARGHVPARLEVKPSFGNLVVWRSIYEADGRFHVDAVRPTFAERTFDGASIARLDVASDFPWLDPSSQQATDIERFARLSDGFVARAAGDGERVLDVRYAFLPTEIAPLWSIRLDRDAPPTAHVRYETHRTNARAGFGMLLAIVLDAGAIE